MDFYQRQQTADSNINQVLYSQTEDDDRVRDSVEVQGQTRKSARPPSANASKMYCHSTLLTVHGRA